MRERVIRAIIWDVDGVFVDTEDLHWRSWKQLFFELGHTLTLDHYTPLIGRPGPQNMAVLCEHFRVDGDQAELIRRRHAIFKELRAHGIPVISKNVELAKAFHSDHPQIVQSVASSSLGMYVRENLINAGLLGQMAVITSADDQAHIKRKPAPDLYLKAIRELGIDPKNILAFEDSSSGVESATRAGLRCIAIPNALTAGHNFSSAIIIIPHDHARQPRDILERLDS